MGIFRKGNLSIPLWLVEPRKEHPTMDRMHRRGKARRAVATMDCNGISKPECGRSECPCDGILLPGNGRGVEIVERVSFQQGASPFCVMDVVLERQTCTHDRVGHR